MLGLAAAFLAGLAAVIASLDGDADIVPFFVGLTLLGGVEAWAAKAPSVGRQRLIARWVAVVWLIAAAWVGVLLTWYVLGSGSSGPPPVPAATYLGLPAAAYHLIGLYGGAALVARSAFRPSRSGAVVPVTAPAESASD